MPRLCVFPKCYMDALVVHRTLSVYDWIALASGLGVDGVEMYPAFLPEPTVECARRVRSVCEQAGLAAPMMCFSPDFTQPDPAARERELERQKQAIDLTVALGGQVCRTLTGQGRPGLDRDAVVGWCAEMIQRAAGYAGSQGIVLALENHYKDNYWNYPEFALRAEVFLQVVTHVESPHFGVNYDPSNALVAGDDPVALLERIKDRVVSMHASDRYLEGGNLDDLRRLERDPVHGYARLIRHGVIGQGLNDYDRIFSLLRGVGFDGWISIEDGVNGMEELRQSVAFVRAKLAQHFPA